MTPQFSRAVDPIFLHVLDLLDRISREEEPSVHEERLKIKAWLDQGEAIIGRGPEWELAKYALVCWIDEVLIEAPWSSREWWYENALEQELFGNRLAYEMFYVRANDASQMAKKDALETFYVCVVLGFRGLYRDQSALYDSQRLGLPASLDDWAKQMSLSIRLGQGRPPISQTGTGGSGAPPLTGQGMLIWTALVGVILSAFVAMFALLFFVK
jgi:type VI secretion system protein ImpK